MKILKIALIIVAISACNNKAETAVMDTNNTINRMTAKDTINYLALGDSYTIGEAVPQAQSFPFQLTALLASDSIQVAQPEIIATTGWTTDQLINAVNQSDVRQKKYNIVTLLIGVNDQYQGLSQVNYRLKFVQVLNTAINLANGKASNVFVLSIPDWGVTPFAQGRDDIIAPQIDQFNAVNKEESTKAGVHYLDITAISRQAKTDRTLVADDGLHPSGKMYALWVSPLAKIVKTEFKK